MSADGNFVNNVLRTKKIPIIPCKIGKIMKNKRCRPFNSVMPTKQQKKMKKKYEAHLNWAQLIKPKKKSHRYLNNNLKHSVNRICNVNETEKLFKKSELNQKFEKVYSELENIGVGSNKTMKENFHSIENTSYSDWEVSSGVINSDAINMKNKGDVLESLICNRPGNFFSLYSESNSDAECKKKYCVSSDLSNVDTWKVHKNLEMDESLTEMLDHKAEFHHISGKSYVLILRHPGQIHFRGTLSVTPIYGITSFLGYELVPGMKSRVMYSPKGISPLCLATTGKTCENIVLPMQFGFDSSILQRLGKNDSAILIEPASGEQWNKLFGLFRRVLKFNPLAITVKEVGECVQMGIDVESNLGVEFVQPANYFSKSIHNESNDWESLSQEIQSFSQEKGQVRLMVFGGKGVGKSTFMRFLVNRWLSQNNPVNALKKDETKRILFIDFDPGQSEFVPPGCLSATLVSEPLLGPNYTHLKDPERMMFVGDVDISQCPKWYLHCANDVIEFCSSENYLSELPWFINTMGFCKGIGSDLAVELIRLCSPTHVVQLNSIWSNRNFNPINLLSWSSVNSWNGQNWYLEIPNFRKCDLPEYSYHMLQSLAERPHTPSEIDKKSNVQNNSTTEDGTIELEEMEDTDSQWGLPAWQSRELCVLAYFSKLAAEPTFSVLKPEPYRLKLSKMTLSLPTSLVKPCYVKSVFNGRIAALCSFGSQTKRSISINNFGACNSDGVFQESVQCIENSKNLWEKVLTPNDLSQPKILFHMPLAPCLGFGIVRGIDSCNHDIYLNSPISNDVLSSVDCLATSPKLGLIPMPLIMDSFKNSKCGSVPYFMPKNNKNVMSRKSPRIFQPFLLSSNVKP